MAMAMAMAMALAMAIIRVRPTSEPDAFRRTAALLVSPA
jgi:hypothetical protein